MAGRSKVTETQQQEVLQTKVKMMTLSAIAREVGHFKYVISWILQQLYNVTNSFESLKKAGRSLKCTRRQDHAETLNEGSVQHCS